MIRKNNRIEDYDFEVSTQKKHKKASGEEDLEETNKFKRASDEQMKRGMDKTTPRSSRPPIEVACTKTEGKVPRLPLSKMRKEK